MSELEGFVKQLARGDFAEFREVGDGVEVRPLLKAEDLRLIRRAFLEYIRSGIAGSDGVKCRDLFKRMLRKVK